MAERTAQLISTQKRSNPELTVATTRGRGAFGDRYGQTVLIGIRVPFGSGPRNDARIATAQAEAIEVQSKLILERDQIQADQRGAASRLEAVRTQLVAAQRREMLANESRGFSTSRSGWARQICPHACALRPRLQRPRDKRLEAELT